MTSGRSPSPTIADQPSPVAALHLYYIKLGRGGDWEAESLRDGVLRFGYREAPHDQCARGDWQGVWEAMKTIRGDAGAATRDVNQIRAYYEADEHSIFITFVGGLLYWCRPSGPVELLDDRSHRRQTAEGWRNTSVNGNLLSADRLSGRLLKVQMFRGTICDVRAGDYLLRKLSDQLSPEVAAAEEAERALMTAIVNLMRLLTWQDFELLVDLIFSTSGWRRVSQVGRTQKTVDLELILPSTAERAFVQVKIAGHIRGPERLCGPSGRGRCLRPDVLRLAHRRHRRGKQSGRRHTSWSAKAFSHGARRRPVIVAAGKGLLTKTTLKA